MKAFVKHQSGHPRAGFGGWLRKAEFQIGRDPLITRGDSDLYPLPQRIRERPCHVVRRVAVGLFHEPDADIVDVSLSAATTPRSSGATIGISKSVGKVRLELSGFPDGIELLLPVAAVIGCAVDCCGNRLRPKTFFQFPKRVGITDAFTWLRRCDRLDDDFLKPSGIEPKVA